MATVATRIQRALRLLGVLESGATPTTNEYSDGLVALNAMLGMWRNDGLLCYAQQTESLTLSASTASYTIGPSGTLNTTRPLEILAAWIEGYPPMRILTAEEYASILVKTQTADRPECVHYEPTMSTGTLYVYPVPNATLTLKLLTWVMVADFAATSDTVTLPPGWDEAIDSNLGVHMAPEYNVAVPAAVAKMASDSLKAIKRTNAQPVKAGVSELVLLAGGGARNIQTDE